jgi:Ca2+-binding EF-hand superfamily protein
MNITLEEISDKNGNVDAAKIKKLLAGGKKTEFSEEVIKAIGYDGVKPMRAENFLRKYTLVKVFFELDIDRSGFLDRHEIAKHLKMDKNAKELQDAFKQIDVNGDGSISLDEFVQAVESQFNS